MPNSSNRLGLSRGNFGQVGPSILRSSMRRVWALPIGVFASAWAGRPFVPLNYRLTGQELESLVGQIAPSRLVTAPDRAEALRGLPDTDVVDREHFLSAARKPTEGPMESDWGMDPDEIAILLFTSGTTGPPKAAVIRHKHLVSYILGSVEFMSADESDAALVSVPPYHIAGMAAIASSVYAGRRIVQLPNFSAERWLELARSEKITNAFVVPTMLSRIIECLDAEGRQNADLPHLRCLVVRWREDAASCDRARDATVPRCRFRKCLRLDGNELHDFYFGARGPSCCDAE